MHAAYAIFFFVGNQLLNHIKNISKALVHVTQKLGSKKGKYEEKSIFNYYPQEK